MQPSKRMLAAYDDAMTTQRSLRATHRTIVAEQSEIALKKFQSVKDLGVRLVACLGISRNPRRSAIGGKRSTRNPPFRAPNDPTTFFPNVPTDTP